MWLFAAIPAKDKVRLNDLSKLTKIEVIRQNLADLCSIEPGRLRLFYSGKQLEDGLKLFDYNMRQGDTVQVLIRPEPATAHKGDEVKEEKESTQEDPDKENKNVETNAPFDFQYVDITKMEAHKGTTSYQVDDNLDWRTGEDGYWDEVVVVLVAPMTPKAAAFAEARLAEVAANGALSPDEPIEQAVYYVRFLKDTGPDGFAAFSFDLRPRAVTRLHFDHLEIGDTVMVNYNTAEPNKHGYYYDAVVKEKKDSRTAKSVICDLIAGKTLVKLEKVQVTLTDHIYAIPEAEVIHSLRSGEVDLPPPRKGVPECGTCQDNPAVLSCKECGCRACGLKEQGHLLLLCDECAGYYHTFCLVPEVSLADLRDDEEWYCPSCKINTNEVVGAGAALKASKRKAKMPSAKEGKTSQRDWGKGMACSGVTKKCTIVPANHVGPIPGVEVGSSWEYRVMVSEAGVHRPPVAGIHGKCAECAYSIVLAGGYEDDVDNGETFLYTGSGGRDLSNNKRTNSQSFDQVLTKTNLALARNCNTKVDPKNGGSAGKSGWRGGKAVRVCRSAKGAKHSKYSPKEGIRYDGVYKVISYWPEKGRAGFVVWRYKLRRDDPVPAPWSAEGKARIKKLGLQMVRKDPSTEETDATPAKRVKFEIAEDLRAMMAADAVNKKSWDEIIEAAELGRKAYMDKIESTFTCICCQEVLYLPVTLPCAHNICKTCLAGSFKAEVYSCGVCRYDLGADYVGEVNGKLRTALKAIYQGYEDARKNS